MKHGSFAPNYRESASLYSSLAFGMPNIIMNSDVLPVQNGLKCWLRNDDIKNGDARTIIQSWPDRSGSGADGVLAPTTGLTYGARPIRITGNAFGPLADFTAGSNQAFGSNINPLADGDNYTLFFVGDNRAFLGRGSDLSGGGGPIGWNIVFANSNFAICTPNVQWNLFFTTPASAYASNGLAQFSCERNITTGIRRVWVNNIIAGTTGVETGAAMRGSATTFTFGFSNAAYGSMSLGEILIYNRLLSDNDRTLVSRYLQKRWYLLMP